MCARQSLPQFASHAGSHGLDITLTLDLLLWAGWSLAQGSRSALGARSSERGDTAPPEPCTRPPRMACGPWERPFLPLPAQSTRRAAATVSQAWCSSASHSDRRRPPGLSHSCQTCPWPRVGTKTVTCDEDPTGDGDPQHWPLHSKIFKRFYLFIFRERWREGGSEGEKQHRGCRSCAPYWGPGPQPRPVP